ncbi:MAG TPA: hypothetical protein QGH16_09530 [Verrucomicrobiota bacterium]|nr:hypothetical protein [Verrucomicrobiota bacterium]
MEEFAPAVIQRVGTFILFGLLGSTMLAVQQHWSFRPMKNTEVLEDTHPVDFLSVES